MRIEVTAEDIERGMQSNACRCPVALAITRAVGREAFVSIGLARFGSPFRDDGGRSFDVKLPDSATEFYQRFDQYKAVAPFSFDLDLDAGAAGG